MASGESFGKTAWAGSSVGTTRNQHRTTPQILNLLIQMKNNGKSDATIKHNSNSLSLLNKYTDLNNPETVKTYIANLQRSTAYKKNLCIAYKQFCKFHSLQWTMPKYKSEHKLPLIPTTENINKIISASTKKYATIFTILAETGLEAHELTTMSRQDIDTEHGIINAQGCKGHNSRSFKLKTATAELLRQYLSRYTNNRPFPRAKIMGQIWMRTRNRTANKLNQPQLKQIPMKNLRHHYATTLYDKTKDILLVKQLLGHKKLETTMFYTQLMPHNEEEEYTVKTATNINEAKNLLEAGFTYIQEIDGIKLYRKRK